MIWILAAVLAAGAGIWLVWLAGLLGNYRTTLGYKARTQMGPYTIVTAYMRDFRHYEETWISLDGETWNREDDGLKPSRATLLTLQGRFAWERERANIASLEKAYRELEKEKP